MGIDVANLFRLHSAISQCQPHTGRAACTARCRGGKMVSIAVSAIAHNLGVNLSATLFSSLQFFQQQHTAALAHHKTAAPGIKGIEARAGSSAVQRAFMLAKPPTPTG